MKEELNEDCGCGASGSELSDTPSYTPSKSTDPMVGKKVKINDGRIGLVDDSIKNSRGETIGYVIEGDRGNFRVFKDKISGLLDEQEDGLASLDTVQGMGDIKAPTPTETGSGDKFPSLTVGTPAAKSEEEKSVTKKKSDKNGSSIMDFKTFLSTAKKNEN